MKIVDTDILLDHFHGNQGAVDFVASHAVRDESLNFCHLSRRGDGRNAVR